MNNKLLRKIKYFSLTDGTSMVPLIYPKDRIYIKPAYFSKLKINDIITFRKNRRLITHRIIYKKRNCVTTKGDNNLKSDERIYSRQIVGKICQVKRKGQIFDLANLYLLQSTLYFAEIVKIKKAFEKEKIDLVFLKGLPLHLFFEKSHPKRIYADCDILVNYKELKIIDNILINYGYKKYDPSYSKLHKLLKNKPTEIQYTRIINGFSVIFDVHFEINFLMNQLGKVNELYSQDLIDRITRDCMDSRKLITINNYQFSILSNEFLILYLALHFFHHNFRGVFRLEFLDKVIRKYGITNYESGIGNKINDYKLNNFVYPVFLLLKKYYSTPLPAKFLDSIKPDKRKMKYIKSNILNINIFDDETRIAAGVARFKNLFFLSPNSFWRKMMIIFNIQVIYSVFWVMIFFFRRSVVRYWKSFLARLSVIL